MLVEDHEIDVEQLQPPVLVGAQQLADDVEVLDLVDPDHDDGQVAGDAVRPQAGRAALVLGQHRRRRPQRRIRVEDPVRQALEEMGFVLLDAEVVELDLGLRPRQDRRPARTSPDSRYLSARSRTCSRDSPTTVEKIAWAVAPGASVDPRRRLKIGSSTAPTVFDRGRPSMTEPGDRTDRPRPRKRARSVSYWMTPSALALDGRDVRGPDRLLVAGSRTARRQERTDRRDRTRSGRTGSGRPGARHRRPAARARSPRTTSARSHGRCEPRLVSDTRRISASCSADTTTVKPVDDRAVAARELGVVLRVVDLVAVGLACRSAGARPTTPRRCPCRA